jgi:hypothetical protein
MVGEPVEQFVREGAAFGALSLLFVYSSLTFESNHSPKVKLTPAAYRKLF